MADATLPTAADIRRLPRWARVAFAARCARQALRFANWPDTFRHQLDQWGEWVTVAEQTAARADDREAAGLLLVPPEGGVEYPANVRPLQDAVHNAVRAGAAGITYRELHEMGFVAELARVFPTPAQADFLLTTSDIPTTDLPAFVGGPPAAYWAAVGVALDRGAVPGGLGRLVRDAHEQYRGNPVFARAATAGVPATVIRRDFQVVETRATAERWTDDSRVPPSVFGPLGEPVSGPPKQFELVIDTYVRSSAGPELAADRLVSLYEKLNEYSLLKYGKGLTLEDFERYVRIDSRLPTGDPS